MTTQSASVLTLSLSTPADVVFLGSVHSVLMKALDGQIEFFPGHMPLLGIYKKVCSACALTKAQIRLSIMTQVMVSSM